MERSLAARLPLGRIARPFGLPALRGPGRPARAPRARDGRRRRTDEGGRLGGIIRAAALLLWGGRRMRIAMITLLVALPVLGGGFLLVRHSSFVAVQRVEISGVHGSEAAAIEAALAAAARHMSTLDVQSGALRSAVAPFRVVSSIVAVASFPHTLRIEVGEQLPVAALLVNGQRTAVAADGMVLGPALASSNLPTLGGYRELATGQRLQDATLLECTALLGVAPRPLARRVDRVYSGPEGLTVAMRNGLLVYFGTASLPHAKWLSLARVLADHSSAGATYVDVRLPARPAAGFAPGTGPASSATSEEATPGSESTVGALAAGLSKEGGGSAASSPSSSTPSSPSEAATESGQTGSGSSTAQAGSESAKEPAKESSTEPSSEAATPTG